MVAGTKDNDCRQSQHVQWRCGFGEAEAGSKIAARVVGRGHHLPLLRRLAATEEKTALSSSDGVVHASEETIVLRSSDFALHALQHGRDLCGVFCQQC